MLGIFAESMMLAVRMNLHHGCEQMARLRREDEDWISQMRNRHQLPAGR